ncbi:hypothetical protein LTR78_006980 [Recurvomyces mirabilis]|uniref:UBA domain-containing protein n=1 Tax=Recurvomyces mirabilis TaxID=574656 RepID=A0AAE0WK16_9PEZI|nr:hypothetical protein LTR78_006980 [Recurvomyces mirabilis]KAK5153364.1 hypothetical protein LTS14_007533 [Recurvomyces mirabilis]
MAHFASLNGATEYARTVEDDEFDFNFQPNPETMARRSISIFSRRGTETPEPKLPFIAQVAVSHELVPQLKRQMTDRQKSWISRTKSVCGGRSYSKTTTPSAAKKPSGTVLRSVPPAKTIKMSALEEEMATSPNEEILSAVSERPRSPGNVTSQAPRSAQHSSVQQQHHFSQAPSSPVAQRTRSERRRSHDNRIGIWANGVAQWDDQLNTSVPHEQHRERVEEAIRENTGFMPLSTDALTTAPSNGQKPTLSVVIPGNDVNKARTMALSTIVQPRPQRPVRSVAPASLVSRFGIAMPAITVTPERIQEHIVSPVESIQHTPPPGAQLGFVAAVFSSEHLRPKASRESTSSVESTNSDQEDASSLSSKRSSATSIEAVAIPLPKRNSKRLSGMALSAARRSSTPMDIARSSPLAELNKPLPPHPLPQPQRLAPTPAAANIRDLRRHSSAGIAPSLSGSNLRRRSAGSMVRPRLSTRSLTRLDKRDNGRAYGHEHLQYVQESDESNSEVEEFLTPTLSQAERELQAHLEPTKIVVAATQEHNPQVPDDLEDILARTASIRRNNSVRSVMQPPERAPTVPRRSRKREWRASTGEAVMRTTLPTRHKSDSYMRESAKNEDAVHRSLTVMRAVHNDDFSQLSLVIPTLHDLVTKTPDLFVEDVDALTPAAAAAASVEDVLLNILSALHSPEDLLNTARIDKGMYRVYKENEMYLVQTTAFNQSPACWEFRQWSPPDRSLSDSSSGASSQLEHTPQSYIRCRRRDEETMQALKVMILAECVAFVRRETAAVLSAPDHPKAQRYNDAFWRIWCFCKIFGCDKGREEDVTGQLDWLKGGLLANNQDVAATMNMNLEFEMSSVLLNPPDFFAKGNADGLSAQQLYDVTELWGCLSSLLQCYQGQVGEAREAGVFGSCQDLVEGDLEKEEWILEEWLYYLLTLGPDVVLEMAEQAANGTSAGFSLAKLNGWTAWTLPSFNGSRSTFLREPVARLYEERIAAAQEAIENPREQEKKEVSRKRVANLAAEIRLQRQSSSYRRSSYTDMHNERAMSAMSRRSSTMSHNTVGSRNSMVSPMTPAPQYTYVSQGTMTPISTALPSFPHFQHHPVSTTVPNYAAWSPRKISPIIEERVVNFNRLSLQNTLAGEVENTSDTAVKTITAMGFTVVQASMALRMTDMGDGLRVDKAVDYLLRQRR